MVKTLSTLTINPDLESLCRPLAGEELRILTAAIEEDGCRDPIVVWRGKNTILDGHNRYRICHRLGLSFASKEITLLSDGDAVNWVIANQLGRRNLSENERTYLWGRRYGAEKRGHGGPREASGQNDHLLSTSEKIAEEYGVGESTIRRAVEFADVVDAVAEKAPAVKAAIMAGNIDKKDVPALAAAEPDELNELAARPANQQRQAAKAIAAGESVEAAGKPADAKGRPIPERLASTFASRGEFRAIMVELAKLKKRVTALAADEVAGVLLRDVADFRAMIDSLGNLHHAVKFSAPYATCPWCEARPNVGCKQCDGRGWVNETVARNAPKERTAR